VILSGSVFDDGLMSSCLSIEIFGEIYLDFVSAISIIYVTFLGLTIHKDQVELAFDRFPSLESLLGDLFWRFLESLSPLEISVISKISSSSAAGRGRLERDAFSL
jgi:hypothetical protein